MKLRSCAKINLGLRILRKRPDGFHDLETIFHEIDLFDEIELRISDRIQFSTDHPSLSSDESNLCIKAACLLRGRFAIKQGVLIRLRKRIPVGAGLGGGSSNAAALCRGLRSLWSISATDDELESLAAELGSDAPFFVRGGSAYATGRGENLRAMDLQLPYWIVTATPDIHVGTPWAYGALQWTKEVMPAGLDSKWTHPTPEFLVQLLQNDFEPVVFASFPLIGRLKERLQTLGAVAAAMSGSGSTVFGLFENRSGAEAAAEALHTDTIVSVTSPDFKPERS